MVSTDKAYKYLTLTPLITKNLVAIHPESGDISGITSTHEGDLKAFISTHIDTHNLYYSVNEPFPNSPNTKLSKDHISSLNALWIDVDPGPKWSDDAILNLKNDMMGLPVPPSFCIDSGNGYQFIWFLTDKLPADVHWIDLEAMNRGLQVKYNTDNVHNIDRILRLPFTNNIPTPKKREKGRTLKESSVTGGSAKSYSLEEIKPLCEPVYAPDRGSDTEDFDDSALINSWDDNKELHKKYLELIESDPKLKKLIDGAIIKPSRSEYDFAITEILKSYGWSLEDTATALWLSPVGKGKELTKREISRAYARSYPMNDLMALPDDVVAEIEESLPEEIKPPKRDYRFAAKTTWKNNRKQLFKGLIDQGAFVALYGRPNTGKSFLSLDLAGHLATGRDWGGYKLKERGSVLMIAAEAGGGAYDARTSALKRRLGLDEECSIKDFPLAVYDKPVDMLGDVKEKKCPSINQIMAQTQFLREDTGFECKLIVIDTLSAVMGGGNENSSDDMGAIIVNLQRLIQLTGATIIIIHHTGKDVAAGLRGHSKLLGALDTSLEIVSNEVGKGVQYELVSRKQRENEDNTRIKFNRLTVQLGVDNDGDPVTSCLVNLETDTDFMSVIESVDFVGEMDLREYYLYLAVALASGLVDDRTDLEGESMVNSLSKGLYDQLVKSGYMSVSELRSDVLKGYTEAGGLVGVKDQLGLKIVFDEVNKNSKFRRNISEMFKTYEDCNRFSVVRSHKNLHNYIKIEKLEDLIGQKGGQNGA